MVLALRSLVEPGFHPTIRVRSFSGKFSAQVTADGLMKKILSRKREVSKSDARISLFYPLFHGRFSFLEGSGTVIRRLKQHRLFQIQAHYGIGRKPMSRKINGNRLCFSISGVKRMRVFAGDSAVGSGDGPTREPKRKAGDISLAFLLATLIFIFDRSLDLSSSSAMVLVLYSPFPASSEEIRPSFPAFDFSFFGIQAFPANAL